MFNIDEVLEIIVRIKSSRIVSKRFITRKRRRRVSKIEKDKKDKNKFYSDRLNSNCDDRVVYTNRRMVAVMI